MGRLFFFAFMTCQFSSDVLIFRRLNLSLLFSGDRCMKNGIIALLLVMLHTRMIAMMHQELGPIEKLQKDTVTSYLVPIDKQPLLLQYLSYNGNSAMHTYEVKKIQIEIDEDFHYKERHIYVLSNGSKAAKEFYHVRALFKKQNYQRCTTHLIIHQ